MFFAGAEQGADNGRAFGGFLIPAEQHIFSGQNHGTQCIFTPVIIDHDSPVIEVGSHSWYQRIGISNRFAYKAAFEYLGIGGFDPEFEAVEYRFRQALTQFGTFFVCELLFTGRLHLIFQLIMWK